MKFESFEEQLTAYALGELDATQIAEVEAVLATNDEARRYVEEVRSLGLHAQEAFSGEPLTAVQRETILMEAGNNAAARAKLRLFRPSRRVAAALAAAAVIVFGVGALAVFQDELREGIVLEQPSRVTQLATGPRDFYTEGEVKRHAEAELTPGPGSAQVVPQTDEYFNDRSASTNLAAGGLRSDPNIQAWAAPVEVAQQLRALGYLGDAPAQADEQRGRTSNLAYEYDANGDGAEQRPRLIIQADGTQLIWTPVDGNGRSIPAAGDSYGLGGGFGGGGMQPGFNLARVDSLATIAVPQQRQEHNTEAYNPIVDNPFKRVIEEPLSTFSIDVDTGAYANVRRFLQQNQLPPKDAVRIEEFLNYFAYDYTPPDNGEPFAAHVELMDCPWNEQHDLMRIGLKGEVIALEDRPAANLVFLLDVSGSMEPENKLPLVRKAMQMLTKELRPDDRIAIVVYAGNSGLVLPSTLGSDQQTILSAIANLNAGGSTNGAQGIELAYQTAQEHFAKDGINRVILATDGDFNVGVTDQGSLQRLIEDKAKSGVFLTVLGVGEGNLKDAMMEQLANHGNGHYAYLDSLREAKKVLVEEVGGTLVTIAKDVKIQMDFNPAQVGAYRLIGYENRILAAQDFDDDTKDAGEIGAGHTVTALYEIAGPTVTDLPTGSGTESRYVGSVPIGNNLDELLTVKLRYKAPQGDTSKLLEIPIKAETRTVADASADSRFAAGVAAFGMLLRESPYRGNANWDMAAELAEDGMGADPHGYRAEFLELLNVARQLMPLEPAQPAQAQTEPATERSGLELVRIVPWTGGKFVAEIQTSTSRPRRYGVGDAFEQYKVLTIDPTIGEVVVYVESQRQLITLRVNQPATEVWNSGNQP